MNFIKAIFTIFTISIFLFSCSVPEVDNLDGSSRGADGSAVEATEESSVETTFVSAELEDFSSTTRMGGEANYSADGWYSNGDFVYTDSNEPLGFTFNVEPGTYELRLMVKALNIDPEMLPDGYDSFRIKIYTAYGFAQYLEIPLSAKGWEKGYITLDISEPTVMFLVSWENPVDGVELEIHSLKLKRIGDALGDNTADDENGEAPDENDDDDADKDDDDDADKDDDDDADKDDDDADKDDDDADKDDDDDADKDDDDEADKDDDDEADKDDDDDADKDDDDDADNDDDDDADKDDDDDADKDDDHDAVVSSLEDGRSYNVVLHGKDVSYTEGDWTATANTIYTYNANEAAYFKTYLGATGTYTIRLMARHYAKNKKDALPSSYESYRVKLVVNGASTVITIPASDNGWEAAYTEVYLVEGSTDVEISWLNPEDGVNFQLHSIKISK